VHAVAFVDRVQAERPGKRERLLIQCKCWNGNVDYDVVSAVAHKVIHHRATKAVIVAAVGFSPSAMKLAEETDAVELIVGSDLQKLLNEYFGPIGMTLSTVF